MSKRTISGLLPLCLAAVVSLMPQLGWSQTAAPAPGSSAAAPAQGTGGDTGCDHRNFLDGYYFLNGRKLFDDERYAAFSLRLSTPVFQDSSGDARAAKTLGFSERVRIADPGEGTARLRIKDSSGQPVGWVERTAVLCGTFPLKDVGGTGLYKRIVVRTDTAVQGQVQPKKLYQTPATSDPRCEGPCAEVSRFQWYFIYAEENDHYLISENANLGSSSGRLMGWLPKEDGYVWNTALGVRPKETLAGPDGVAVPGVPEKYACAYRTMEELNAARPGDCNQILGGSRWFSLHVRMAMVQQTQRAYEVLFSNAGTAGRDNTSAIAQGLNNLDVFFVLDGTKSMGNVISAVKTLMTQINSRMKSKINDGGVVRYGFRIYRDSNPKTKQDGVSNSEALPLSKTFCNKDNLSEFNTAFAPVRAYDPDEDDDFPENSLGALVQASDDISGCPNNAKLVFVIGDAGYDPDKQRSRSFAVWNEQQVAARFKSGGAGSKFGTPPIVVFIQPPRQTSGVSNQTNYDSAYSAFESQGKSILSQLYGGTKLSGFATSNFLRLPAEVVGPGQQAAIDTALQRIDASMNPAAISELTAGLQAGQSLEQIIERLRANSSLNIPINYLQFVEESLCRRLGDQCRTQVLEAVNRAFVPADDKVVAEVLMSKDQLEKWQKILYLYKNLSGNVAGRAGREQLINTMLAALATIIQVDMQNDGVKLSDKLQFGAGLPASGRSPLMQYSDSDLMDPNNVPTCEIDNLKSYAIKKYDVLDIPLKSDGKSRSNFIEALWPEGGCAMSAKGKAVPFVDGDVRPYNLNRSGQTNFSMMHKRGNDSFFWLPVNYLP
ncbi:MAG TPA: hypothetical protein VNJ49_11235 [Bradyrhizobium sp.]|nr:hypothetical protein [Bradyrhizobium sp.]